MATLQPFRLLSIEELLKVQQPRWLIRTLFEVGALVVLYGPSGEGKTFTVLDWLLSVATGKEWLGHQVAPGPVVYVMGEGAGGARKRVAAWMRANEVSSISDAFVLAEPVQLLNDEAVDAFMVLIRDLAMRPVLVAFDTMARCFQDGDENQARDVGRLVESVRRIQRELHVAVVVVHHTGKQAKDIERGSNALRGAADVMILQRQDSRGVITISNNKQKDHDEFKPITARLKVIDMGFDADGEPMTSCVLVPSQVAQADLAAGPALPALRVLAAIPGGQASSAEWRKALAAELGGSVPEKTFHNWRTGLLADGLVEKLSGHRSHYRITEKGRAVAFASMAREGQGGVPGGQKKVGQNARGRRRPPATAKTLP